MLNPYPKYLIEYEINENGVILYESKPFEPFRTDCDHCEHFRTNSLIHPTGKCSIHNFWCSYGFTCKDWRKM